MATVAGFTTADIHAAAQSAGAGGEVNFPAGTYASDGLKVQYADQTWIGVRPSRTIFKRTNTTVENCLDVQADGFRLRGITIDGNRDNNPNTASGIGAFGYSLDLRDFAIVGTKHWGITQTDAQLTMIDFDISRTGQAAVFWRITNGGSWQQGPHIERGFISRSNPADYIDSGCIAILGLANKRVLAPRVLNVRMNSMIGSELNSGGVGIFNGERCFVHGNEVIGGRIGISLVGTGFSNVQGNNLSKCSSYHIELAGGSANNAVDGNTIQGTGLSSGIENSGQSNWNRIGSNTISACPKPVRVAPGCNGCRVFNN